MSPEVLTPHAATLHWMFTGVSDHPRDEEAAMAAGRTRGEPEDRGDGGRAVRWHVAASATVAVATAGFLASSMLDAPLVSILVIGLLLVCPLLMWVPFRLERGPRRYPGSEPRDPTG